MRTTHLHVGAAALLLLAAWVGSAHGVVDRARTLNIDPAHPVAGDSVTVRLVLGMLPEGWVPNISVTGAVMSSGRPVDGHRCTAVALQYTVGDLDTTRPAGQDSVSYGPIFALDEVDTGYYIVRDPHDWDTLALFRVDTAGAPEGIVVGGRVVSAVDTGTALMGACVRMSYPDVETTIPLSKCVEEPAQKAIRYIRTDSLGRYEFTGLEEGIYTFTFYRDGFLEHTCQIPVTRSRALDAGLVPTSAGFSLSGHVTAVACSGAVCEEYPAVGAEVVVACECDSAQNEQRCFLLADGTVRCLREYCVAVTDSQGGYRFTDLPGGAGMLLVLGVLPGHTPVNAWIEHAPGEEVVRNIRVFTRYAHCATRDHGSLRFSLCSPTDTCPLDSTTVVRYTVTNTGSQDTVLTFMRTCPPLGVSSIRMEPCSFGAAGIGLGFPVKPDACSNATSLVTLPPGESFSLGPLEVTFAPENPAPVERLAICGWLEGSEDVSEASLMLSHESAQEHVVKPDRSGHPPPSCAFAGGAIALLLDAPGTVCVERYDLTGRRLTVLHGPDLLPAGRYRVPLPVQHSGGRTVLLRVRVNGETLAVLRTVSSVDE